jgi:aminoglycoside phosphotransferase (APT) family kinase protein
MHDMVAAFVARVAGRGVTKVKTLHGSVANHDFVVQLDSLSSMMVKAGPRNEMAAEAWACRRLDGAGVPVPRVVALELDAGVGGLPTLVLSFVAGDPSDDPRVVHQAGLALRRVHAEHLPGWGPLVVEAADNGGSAGRGKYESWREAVLAGLAGLPDLISAGILEAELGAAARSCVVVDEVLDYQGPGVLLHNDLKPAHLLATVDDREARLSALIDWGDASVGDPLVDLARLSMAGSPATEAFLAGYGRPMMPEYAERFARYRILWNITALTNEFRAGGDWFHVYRQRIADDTRRLTTTSDKT